jgi:hypothetical protein
VGLGRKLPYVKRETQVDLLRVVSRPEARYSLRVKARNESGSAMRSISTMRPAAILSPTTAVGGDRGREPIPLRR